ncbi:hypothetical protein, partial [Marinospirillum sp.]|uniref:hypothetical protein n=1 Tax=Marinospirillum sp. TaxID=2183934 RepID=UPI0025C63BF0
FPLISPPDWARVYADFAKTEELVFKGADSSSLTDRGTEKLENILLHLHNAAFCHTICAILRPLPPRTPSYCHANPFPKPSS